MKQADRIQQADLQTTEACGHDHHDQKYILQLTVAF